MTLHHRLSSSDRQAFEAAIVWVFSRAASTTAGARLLIDRLDDLASAGETWAERVLAGMKHDGARRIMVAHAKRDRGSVTVAYNGSTMAATLPSRLAVPVRSDDGTATGEYQYPLWTILTWDQFFGALRQQVDRAFQADIRLAAMQQVAALHDRFPETLTPGEACRIAGIDPRDFQLDEVAS